MNILCSILLSLFFIPGFVLFYFCFLMTIMLLGNGGIKEGAIIKPFLLKKRKELIKIYFKFFIGGITCTAIPVLWFYYV